GPLFWLVGVVGAAVTAFYMTRLMALVFWGKSRVPANVHPHESPPSMTIPLIILGILSVVGGWVGIPHVISAVLPGHPPNLLEGWLAPALAKLPHEIHGTALLEWSLMGISVGIAGMSAWFAYDSYIKDPERPKRLTDRIKPVYELVNGKYWVDEFYFARIISPLVEISKGLWAYIDVNFIDKATYSVSDLVKSAGNGIRAMQNGNLQHYALMIALGLVLVMIFAL
ncbi:MAG: NADH-quinone oxidoreductase subunit L, partial [Bdellovibrionales bacterium]|nr:NADH-quinone oxidoreductase subunit L [Bdellovibrionales bacterium]